jgi:ABC-2 type transport system ATP-binding protein
VHQGDICGFLGPNGAGKTTTLRIILGMLQPDDGAVSVLGMDPGINGTYLRQRVNALPEDQGLYGWMSALGYLKLFSQLYAMDLELAELQDRLRQVGLDAENSRPIRTYSQGMKQRLGIARALVNDPAILLLDEPTNGIDPRGRREIHDLLVRLNKENNLTIIISTHILDDVERLCNRIAILDQGRIRYEGPLSQRFDRATSLYRFHLAPGGPALEPWTYQGLTLLEQNGDCLTCLLQGLSPTTAIRLLVESGCPLIEAEAVSGGLEALYLEHTGGGAA